MCVTPARSHTHAGPLDHNVRSVLLTRLVPLMAAPVTLFLVATKRPITEQGLYFIYWNVQALTQLMELGIGSLIVQFASHESTSVGWSERGAIIGAESTTQRLHAVVLEGIRWYSRIALVLLTLGGAGGAWLLQSRSAGIMPSPLAPWLVTILATTAYLPTIPLLCVVEGSGGLLRVQRMRLAQVAVALIGLWCTLPIWGALWGVAVFSLVWLIVALAWLAREHSELLRDLYRGRLRATPSLLGAQQWRTAMTWLAWWIAPQALSPIMLAFHGAAAAGRVGMTLAIAAAPLTLSIAWLAARYPNYGALLARGARFELAHVARRATGQALVVLVAGTLGAAAAIWLLDRTLPALGARVLSPAALAILGVSNVAWLLVQALGGYLRAWRVERLMEAALIGAAVVTVGTVAAAHLLSTFATVVAYSLLVVLVVLPLSMRVLRRHERVRVSSPHIMQ